MMKKVVMWVLIGIVWSAAVMAEEPVSTPAPSVKSNQQHSLDVDLIWGGQFRLRGSGSHYYPAMPIGLEASRDWWVLSVLGRIGNPLGVQFRPRLQVELPATADWTIMPGVGGIFSFTYEDDDDYKAIETGAYFAIWMRYALSPRLHLRASPIGLDFNFWRYTWSRFYDYNQNIQTTTSRSNTNLLIIYNLMVGIGYSF